MRDALVASALGLAIHASIPLTKVGIISDIPLRAGKVAGLNLYNLLVDASNTPLPQRVAMLSYLMDAISPLFSIQLFNVAAFFPFVRRIVTKRQGEGIHTKWNRLDEPLIRMLEAIPAGSRIETQTSWFQEAILLRSNGEANSRLEVSLFVLLDLFLFKLGAGYVVYIYSYQHSGA